MPKKNLRVFFDISIGNTAGGRVIFELFPDLTPKTVENFRGLCTGEYGIGKTTKKPLSYEGSEIFRCAKGSMIQGGDFVHNSGDGGESVYGGTFADEDFTRRHQCAGILSMANNGRHSNGSQFFVTLRRCVHFDGKHVAFGQVVDGMDVIRAISLIPVDGNDRPRVNVKIVASGEVDGKQFDRRSGADPLVAFHKGIAAMAEEVETGGVKVRESDKAKKILDGGQGGAAVPPPTPGSSSRRSDAEEPEEGGHAPARNERERRLMELRMRMNQGRQSNTKEVVEEQKRNSDPDYAKKKAEEAFQKAEAKREAKGSSDARPLALPAGKEYLLETAEKHEMKEGKKKRGNPDAFGWDVFNQDSLYRAHDKRLKTVEFDEKGYKDQKAFIESGNDVNAGLFAGFGFQASDEGKDRLVAALDKQAAARQKFQRRRETVDDEEVTYVNDRNRHFNQKIQRAFGAYTAETRQNLERGTAL